MEQRYTCSVFLLATDGSDASCTLGRELLERSGFDILDGFSVPRDEAEAGLRALAVSSRPALEKPRYEAQVYDAWVAVDVCPWPASGDGKVDNGRLTRIDVINKALSTAPTIQRANSDQQPAGPAPVVWATDNSRQAWCLMQRWRPERLQAYEKECERRVSALQPPFEIVACFDGYNNNARVDLVRASAGMAVCKTFRSGRERYFENEVAGLQLAEYSSAVPPLLDCGENWVLMPYYEDYTPVEDRIYRQKLQSLLPLSLARKVFLEARRIHDAGYAHLDFHARHVLVDENDDIKIYDFDRLHRFEEIPPFHESPMIAGADSWLEYDGPNGGIPSYEKNWKHLVGLELEILLEGSPTKQYAERTAIEAARFPGRVRHFLKNRFRS